jgi:hypothetical protein
MLKVAENVTNYYKMRTIFIVTLIEVVSYGTQPRVEWDTCPVEKKSEFIHIWSLYICLFHRLNYDPSVD